MAAHLKPEDFKIMAILEKLPFANEERQLWLDTIQTSGMNEETAREILAKLPDIPKEEGSAVSQARNSADLARLINRWRLSRNLMHARGHK